MPELPEVETIVRELRSILPNRTLISLEEYYKGTIHLPASLPSIVKDSGSQSYNHYIQYRLTDTWQIDSLVRRGKYIVIHFQNQKSIIIHLRMTGKLIFSNNYGLPENNKVKHIRGKLNFADGSSLLFDDPRTFGIIKIVNTSDVKDILCRLGCEPLSIDLNGEYLDRILSKRKSTIKKVLLDQHVIAGIGNIYANEILYRSKILPDRLTTSLTAKETSTLVRTIKEVLKQAIKCNGTTISDFRRVDDKKGTFQNFLQVYGKKTCPNNHPVNKVTIDGRSTYYCRKCQK